MRDRGMEELRAPVPSAELALVADVSLVPEFDIETMLQTDERFQRLSQLAHEKNLTPLTLTSIQAVRQRWVTERAGAWNCFNDMTAFVEASSDPEFIASLLTEREQLLEHELDDLVFGDPESELRSWMLTYHIPKSPAEHLQKWLSGNGLSATGGTAVLHQMVTERYAAWAGPIKQTVLEQYRPEIQQFAVVDSDVSIPTIGVSIQAAFAQKYLRHYDALLDKALDESIADLEGMDAFEHSVPPRITMSARVLRWLSTTDPASIPDYSSRDHQALRRFFNLSQTLTTLGESINGDAAKESLMQEFEGAVGYGRFKIACQDVTNRAEADLLLRMDPKQVDEFLDQFEDLVDNYWRGSRTHYSYEGGSRQTYTNSSHDSNQSSGDQSNGSSSESKDQSSAYEQFASHHRITFDVIDPGDNNAFTVASGSVCDAIDSATTRHWRTTYSNPVIDSLLNAINQKALDANAKFEPRKVFRRLSAEFHPDRSQDIEQQAVLGEMAREVNDLWQRFDAGQMLISFEAGKISIKISDLNLRT